MTDPDTAVVLTPGQARELIGCSYEFVISLMDDGLLRCEQRGTGSRRWRRTSKAWVMDYLRGDKRAVLHRGQDVRNAQPATPRRTGTDHVIGLEYAGPARSTAVRRVRADRS